MNNINDPYSYAGQPASARGPALAGGLACLMALVALVSCSNAKPNAELSADALSGLDETARRIVDEVLEDETLADLCAGGESRVRSEVRRETMALVFTEGLSNPRDPGTAAGEFLAEQCKLRFPDYDTSPE